MIGMTVLSLGVVVAACLLAFAGLPTGKPKFRKQLPEGVVELVGVGASEGTGLVELDDDSLLLVAGMERRISTDGGASWGDAEPLNCKTMGRPGNLSCIRTASGELALAHRGKEEFVAGTEEAGWTPFYLSVSEDEGKSWSGGWPMNLLGGPYYDAMIQLSTGRLLMPSRICYSNNAHPGLEYERASSYGYWNGLRVQVTGHYHYPEIDIAAASYSDDDGRTWQRCNGQLMGWFDAEGIPNGRGGVTAVDEPNVAECADGRVMMLARSTVGRLVQSYSGDGGENWEPILPSELPSSYSPPRLRRIPDSGDLLCIWNQVSRDEIRRGYRRGRLSAAISQDNGASWEYFNTIEVSAGIQDVDRISPQYPISPIGAIAELGTLPDDWATFDYPNAWFIGDKVLLMYHRSWIEAAEDAEEAVTLGERTGSAKKPGETVLRLYPLTWFYT